jgi:hypothetical protein
VRKVVINKPMPATTTEQEDIVTAGQRRINIIWEVTQATIAITCTGAMIYCGIKKIDATELKNAFFLIIGFYFSRTNHTAIGGTGKKSLATNTGTR